MNVRSFGLVPFILLLLAAPAAAQDAADDAWAAGENERARELYAARVAADSGDVPAMHRLGLLLSWNREYADGIRLFDRVLELTPADTSVAHARARVLSWSGRLAEAHDAYLGLLERDPNDLEAMRGLARVASWRGDLAAGEQLWRRALAVDPSSAEARLGLSQVLRWRGQPGEALVEAETAARLDPGNRDAQLQLAWAEAAFAPRITPSFSAEFDSDDNRLLTSALGITVFPAHRVAVTATGYLRRAEDGRAGIEAVNSRAATLGARFDLGAGWSLGGSAGVNDRDVPGAAPDAKPEAIWSASFASTPWRPVTGTLAYAHGVFDATALLIASDVTTDELAATGAARLTRSVRLEGAAVVTRFQGVERNDRALGRLGLEVAATQWLRFRPRAMGFGFEQDLEEGYFDPDRYLLGELGVGVDRYRGAWSFSGEVAPGAQQVGSEGEVQGALSARARVGYTVGPGREVGIAFSLSNLGIERLDPNGAGYRYSAAVISAAWGF
jgi:tetratricopeptide (TPR) repeat protein